MKKNKMLKINEQNKILKINEKNKIKYNGINKMIVNNDIKERKKYNKINGVWS